MGNRNGKIVLEGKDLIVLSTASGMAAQKVKKKFDDFVRKYPNGKVSKKQFKLLLSKTLPKQIEEIEKLTNLIFQVFDSNHDGSIDFVEFMATYNPMNQGSNGEVLGKLFRLFYEDGDGIMSDEEIRHLGKLIEAGSSKEKSSDIYKWTRSTLIEEKSSSELQLVDDKSFCIEQGKSSSELQLVDDKSFYIEQGKSSSELQIVDDKSFHIEEGRSSTEVQLKSDKTEAKSSMYPLVRNKSFYIETGLEEPKNEEDPSGTIKVEAVFHQTLEGCIDTKLEDDVIGNLEDDNNRKLKDDNISKPEDVNSKLEDVDSNLVDDNNRKLEDRLDSKPEYNITSQLEDGFNTKNDDSKINDEVDIKLEDYVDSPLDGGIISTVKVNTTSSSEVALAVDNKRILEDDIDANDEDIESRLEEKDFITIPREDDVDSKLVEDIHNVHKEGDVNSALESIMSITEEDINKLKMKLTLRKKLIEEKRNAERELTEKGFVIKSTDIIQVKSSSKPSTEPQTRIQEETVINPSIAKLTEEKTITEHELVGKGFVIKSSDLIQVKSLLKPTINSQFVLANTQYKNKEDSEPLNLNILSADVTEDQNIDEIEGGSFLGQANLLDSSTKLMNAFTDDAGSFLEKTNLLDSVTEELDAFSEEEVLSSTIVDEEGTLAVSKSKNSSTHKQDKQVGKLNGSSLMDFWNEKMTIENDPSRFSRS